MMNLIFSFEFRFFIKKLILNLEIIIKNISEPSNLNSVVWRGFKFVSKKTYLDIRAPTTAQNIDKNEKI